MSKQIIVTELAPAAIGAYSQAVRVADTVYISGQIPLDPITMETVEGGFSAQAKRVFENLQAIADAAGGSLANTVKLTVYLTDLTDFAALNEVMDSYIPAPYPARAAVQVAALPRDAMVEIDAVLYLG